MEEEWRDVVGYEGMYEISSLGVLRSLNRVVPNHISKTRVGKSNFNGKILKFWLDKYGYEVVSVCRNAKREKTYIHRAVAIAFIPNPNNYPFVNHLDGNKRNNNVYNLEWCTAIMNVRHAYSSGLMDSNKGERNFHSVLKDIDIPIIRELNDYGISPYEISNRYGCSPATIYDVIKKRTWKHI